MESLNRSMDIATKLDNGRTVTGKMYFSRSRKGRFKVYYDGNMKNDHKDDYADIDEMESGALILLKNMAEKAA